MKKTIQELINQLQTYNPDDVVFSAIYTKDDVKELEHYDPITGQVVYPYDDELAEKVLSAIDDYDSIHEYIYSCIEQEISYQVDQLSKLENVKVESPSY